MKNVTELYERENKHTWSYKRYILYAGLFLLPLYFHPFIHANICPVVNSPRHDYLMFEYNEKYNSPSLEFPIENAGKNGEMKMGANTVCSYIQ